MTSTALATEVNLDELGRMGRMLAMSGYFEASTNGTVAIAQLSVKVLAGREMGFGPFASAQGIHIIKGKPALSANLMAAAVKSSGRYNYRIRKMTDTEVSIEFFELFNGKWESCGPASTFTAADAAKAGTQNMNKYPRNMLFARAMSNGVRWYCPDVFSGNAIYVPEELGASMDDNGMVIVVDESGTVIESDSKFTNANVTDEPEQQRVLPEEVNFMDDPAPFELEESVHVELLDAKLLKKLHAVGTQLYGDGWDDKRHELVTSITKARTNSSSLLTPDEANKLIDGMNKKIAAAA